MNKRQLIIAIIAVAVLVGVYILTQKSEQSNWAAGHSADRRNLIENFDVNNVSKITMTQGDSSAVFEKKDGTWKVTGNNDYPADFSKISKFLVKLKDMKVAQQIKVGKSMLGKLDLDTDSAITVTLADKEGKTINEVLVGKEHIPKQSTPQPMLYGGPRPDGRYLLVQGQKIPSLVRDTLSEVSTASSDWIDKTFVDIKDPLSIELTNNKGEKVWSLTREKKADTFTCSVIPKENQELNSSTVSSVSSAFNYFNFENAKPKADMTLDSADTVVVKTADNFTYNLKLEKKDDKYYLAPSVSAVFKEKREPGKDETPEEKEKQDKEFAATLKKLQEKLKKEQFYNDWVYEISSYKAEALLKKAADFVKEKKKEADK